jgi:non-ribosomal peptide synthetase-like protein
VARDSTFDHLKTPAELRPRLAAKNRHNIVTMALFLAVRWLHMCVLTVLGLAAVELSARFTGLVVAAFLLGVVVFSSGYFLLVERAFMAFRPLRPRFCSIYEPYFWWHERYWKLLTPYLSALNGTPFKSLVWRALGVRIGRRVFDDGCAIAERSLVSIGDDTMLNAGTIIQCHSMEDGAFKSDRTEIGAGCTLGAGAFVHYGVRVADGTVLEPDSFLMKGEQTTPHSRWGGNPAQQR